MYNKAILVVGIGKTPIKEGPKDATEIIKVYILGRKS